MDYWLLGFIFLAGAITFTMATLTAGGGALVLVPIVNYLAGPGIAAPILNTGNLIGRPVRIIIFWKDINWKATLFYVPAAMTGAFLGAMLFSTLKIDWLQIIIGLFLVSTIWQFSWGKKKKSFQMKYSYLLPLGFLISILGTIIGGLGPVLNPFYLNLGITKESLIATKTANSFFMGLAQIGSYAYFGLMSTEVIYPAIALGLGISVGSYFGKLVLKRVSDQSFRKWVILFMVISGLLMLYQGITAL
ncbi:MAG: sulfite exporter TauE/SafE family protein [Cyclobacteriaceae bacterium]|nr:sulfite exporter TauE/SafE family protein [Cyclobacteriaceae bacterium SS2]